MSVFNIIWVIGALLMWVVLARVVYLEQQNVFTDLKYIHVIVLALVGFVPIANLCVAAVIVLLYPGLVDMSNWWINQKVYKASADQSEEK